MNKLTRTLIAATAACAALSTAYAEDPTGTTAPTSTTASAPGTLTNQDAKDLKTHSKAEYKARKKVADANKELDKADCKTALDGAAARACKKEARAAAKEAKAEAKVIHETEKADIKANTK